MTILGLIFVSLGVGLFVIRQMSSDNPQNQSPQDSATAEPKASNNQLLTTPTPISTPFKAYFAIFTSGTFRLFDNARYKNQDSKIFIDDQSINSVTVTDINTTWQYFFDTLPMKLTRDCLTTGTGQKFCNNTTSNLKFFVNGVENPNALSEIINEGDRLLVTYGSTGSATIQSQLDRLNKIEN